MPSPHPSPGSRGASRFEATVAVAIVAVLIALVLPRLDDSRSTLRQVRLKMLLSTTQTTANLFHLRCETAPVPASSAESSCDALVLNDQKVVGMHGWPAASADGIAVALNSWGQTADIDWRPDRIDGVPALRARLKPADVAGKCEFIYAQAASPGAVPRIELLDASCP